MKIINETEYRTYRVNWEKALKNYGFTHEEPQNAMEMPQIYTVGKTPKLW